jgi:ribosome-binding protein aMBF1 (putative translation factor)
MFPYLVVETMLRGIRPDIVLTEKSLQLPEDTTEDQWLRIGEQLANLHNGIQWIIGDWWAFGNHKYGDRKKLFKDGKWNGLSFQTCVDYGVTSRAYPESKSRDLPISHRHYKTVADLPAKHAAALLDEAVTQKLSVKKLRERAKPLKEVAKAVKAEAKKTQRASNVVRLPISHKKRPTRKQQADVQTVVENYLSDIAVGLNRAVLSYEDLTEYVNSRGGLKIGDITTITNAKLAAIAKSLRRLAGLLNVKDVRELLKIGVA